MSDSTGPRLRVLVHILEYLPLFSGHGIYLHRLVPSLRAAGVDVTVLTADFGRLPAAETIDGVPVFRFRYSLHESRSDLKAAARTVAFLARHRSEFDIVHLNGFADTVGLIGSAAHALGMAVVTQLVLIGADDPESVSTQNRFGRLRLWAMARADRILCISPQLLESCRRARFDAGRLVFVPQGVDTRRFRPVSPDERSALRHRLGLSTSSPVVTFVGAIIERKGVDILLRAWAELAKRLPEAELLLVGPDTFGADDVSAVALNRFVDGMKALASSGGLRVRFLGRQERVEEYLQAADVFVLPSRHEGFGNVIIEALACGVPAVVTRMDGVGEVTVRHGDNGLIVDDEDGLTHALLSLLENPDARARMGQTARCVAEDTFSVERVVRSYRDVYEAALRSR
jgi:glycosyltransferase involved in cell wall biosynthesis